MSKRKHALQRDANVELVLEAMTPGGHALAKHEGLPVFVHRGVPGDRVNALLFDVRKDFAHASVQSVLEAGPARTEAPCALFKVCGGCQWQHINYDAQLQFKTDIVKQALSRIGKIDPECVYPCMSAGEPLFYRNKVQYPVSQPRNSSRILAGYYKEGSHELVNIKHCPVQPEPLDRVLEAVKLACENARIPAFEEKTHSGLLRHIACRYSFSDNEALVTLVLNATENDLKGLWRRLVDLAREVKDSVKEVCGVCVNLNPRRGNRIIGDRTETLWGRPYIIERLKSNLAQAPEQLQRGLELQLSPESFFQVNTRAAALLYDQVYLAVQAWRQERGQDLGLVVDAYGGVGTIGMWIASLCRQVVCIEEVKAAVLCGQQILRTNKIDNLEMKAGTVENVLGQMAEASETADLVILDPPRAGASESCLEALKRLRAGRIIYVSCDPATLARDLKVLAEAGYATTSVQPVDMFPQTHHVECVALLSRLT